MNQTPRYIAAFVAGFAFCIACNVGPSTSSAQSSCTVVATFAAADANGNGVLDPEEGNGDLYNSQGLACPDGWSYLGAGPSGEAAVCER